MGLFFPAWFAPAEGHLPWKRTFLILMQPWLKDRSSLKRCLPCYFHFYLKYSFPNILLKFFSGVQTTGKPIATHLHASLGNDCHAVIFTFSPNKLLPELRARFKYLCTCASITQEQGVSCIIHNLIILRKKWGLGLERGSEAKGGFKYWYTWWADHNVLQLQLQGIQYLLLVSKIMRAHTSTHTHTHLKKAFKNDALLQWYLNAAHIQTSSGYFKHECIPFDSKF